MRPPGRRSRWTARSRRPPRRRSRGSAWPRPRRRRRDVAGDHPQSGRRPGSRRPPSRRGRPRRPRGRSPGRRGDGRRGPRGRGARCSPESGSSRIGERPDEAIADRGERLAVVEVDDPPDPQPAEADHVGDVLRRPTARRRRRTRSGHRRPPTGRRGRGWSAMVGRTSMVDTFASSTAPSAWPGTLDQERCVGDGVDGGRLDVAAGGVGLEGDPVVGGHDDERLVVEAGVSESVEDLPDDLVGVLRLQEVLLLAHRARPGAPREQVPCCPPPAGPMPNGSTTSYFVPSGYRLNGWWGRIRCR